MGTYPIKPENPGDWFKDIEKRFGGSEPGLGKGTGTGGSSGGGTGGGMGGGSGSGLSSQEPKMPQAAKLTTPSSSYPHSMESQLRAYAPKAVTTGSRGGTRSMVSYMPMSSFMGGASPPTASASASPALGGPQLTPGTLPRTASAGGSGGGLATVGLAAATPFLALLGKEMLGKKDD